MNYSIEHHIKRNLYLSSTPRKKLLKNTLLVVHQGTVLIKLGKHEYAIQENKAFWLPSECLTSITTLPNSLVSQVDFSVRLTDVFPAQAGYIKLSPLFTATISKLRTEELSSSYKAVLMQVLREESLQVNPVLQLDKFSKMITEWKANDKGAVTAELHLVLRLREAKKQLLSGTKKDKIISTSFSDLGTDFDNLCESVFGEQL